MGPAVTSSTSSSRARAAETTAGKRLVDVLDLHWYPEATGGGTRAFGEHTTAAVADYFGGGNHISGAIAQADVLGIFGREGVFAAALWPMTSNISYLDAAFRMFRDVDGAGLHFGETSVKAETSDVATATVYASTRTADGKVVMVVINKASTPKTTSLAITHATALPTAAVYQLTSAGSAPVRVADVAATRPNSFSLTLPAQSVTTLVFGG
jgi:hypothetical protein